MNYSIGDVVQYHNAENTEGLYWRIYIVADVLNTVVVSDKGIRMLKENVERISL